LEERQNILGIVYEDKLIFKLYPLNKSYNKLINVKTYILIK